MRWLLVLVACAVLTGCPQKEDTAPDTKPAAAAPALSLKARCEDSCLLLTEYSFDELQGGLYCTKCGAFDEFACELDWPSSDVPSCDNVAEMRNCIFAAHGYVFTKDKWKKRFAERAWYKPDPTFKAEQLSAVERANVEALKKYPCEEY